MSDDVEVDEPMSIEETLAELHGEIHLLRATTGECWCLGGEMQRVWRLSLDHCAELIEKAACKNDEMRERFDVMEKRELEWWGGREGRNQLIGLMEGYAVKVEDAHKYE